MRPPVVAGRAAIVQMSGAAGSVPDLARLCYGMILYTSKVDSVGGDWNPPAMPCCMRGMRISSRKVSLIGRS